MSGADYDELENQVSRFRALANAAFEALALHERGVITDVNDAFVELFGYAREEAVGKHVIEFAAPESRPLLEEKLRSGAVSAYEGLALRKDGTRFAVQVRGRPITVGGIELRAVALRDIGGARAMGGVFDRITESVVGLDANFRFMFANHAASVVFRTDLESLIGAVLWEAFPTMDGSPLQAQLERARETQEATEVELDSPMLGHTLHIRIFPSPEGMTLHTRDVTEQRRLEGQLREAQRLEVIGQLAGGVAHDFNNLMTVVLANASMLRRMSAPGGPFDAGLADLEYAGRRAAELTQQLLAFGRRQVMRPRPLDLNEILRENATTVQRLAREDTELRLVLAPELGVIEADRVQVEQVLMNLAANARDAMPTGGTLTIETKNVTVGEARGPEYASVNPGEYVLLSIKDTGVGMDAETTARVFEPFFTTKELGHGTGLGLATVFGIVKQSQGHLRVESARGQGSTFEVYFPRVAGVPAPVVAAEPAAGAGSGSETILVVEDEDAVRRLLGAVLRRAGYAVIEASGPTEALATWEAAGGAALLLTDVVMPTMDGRKLAAELARSRPELRVVYMSGYTEDVIVNRALDAGVSFLQKPITVDELLRTVRAALDAPEPPRR